MGFRNQLTCLKIYDDIWLTGQLILLHVIQTTCGLFDFRVSGLPSPGGLEFIEVSKTDST